MAAQIIMAILSLAALGVLAWDCVRQQRLEKANCMAEIFREEK